MGVDNPFERAKGGIQLPSKGQIAIPRTDEKAKTTNLPVIKVEDEKALEGTHIVDPETDDTMEYVSMDAKRGLALTQMMTSQPNLDTAAEQAITRAEILKQYGGLESNIPQSHPTYWKSKQ